MNAHSASLTLDGMVRALTPKLLPQAKPAMLRDVLAMKRARGDTDCAAFKATACREFATGLNATIEGSARAMREWIAKGIRHYPAYREARVAFLADLDRVLAGDIADWRPEMARA